MNWEHKEGLGRRKDRAEGRTLQDLTVTTTRDTVVPAANLDLGYSSRHWVGPFSITNWKSATECEVAAASAAIQIGTFIWFSAARRDFSTFWPGIKPKSCIPGQFTAWHWVSPAVTVLLLVPAHFHEASPKASTCQLRNCHPQTGLPLCCFPPLLFLISAAPPLQDVFIARYKKTNRIPIQVLPPLC